CFWPVFPKIRLREYGFRLSAINDLMLSEARNVREAVAVQHDQARRNERVAHGINVAVVAGEVAQLERAGLPFQAPLAVRFAPCRLIQQARQWVELDNVGTREKFWLDRSYSCHVNLLPSGFRNPPTRRARAVRRGSVQREAV